MLVIALGAFSACGSVTVQDDAGTGDDAGMGDDDAAPTAPPNQNKELSGAAGTLQSPSYTFDVQLGHPFSQEKASGGDKSVEGAAAVKP